MHTLQESEGKTECKSVISPVKFLEKLLYFKNFFSITCTIITIRPKTCIEKLNVDVFFNLY